MPAERLLVTFPFTFLMQPLGLLHLKHECCRNVVILFFSSLFLGGKLLQRKRERGKKYVVLHLVSGSCFAYPLLNAGCGQRTCGGKYYVIDCNFIESYFGLFQLNSFALFFFFVGCTSKLVTSLEVQENVFQEPRLHNCCVDFSSTTVEIQIVVCNLSRFPYYK